MRETYPIDARRAGTRGQYQTNLVTADVVAGGDGTQIKGNGSRVALIVAARFNAPALGDGAAICSSIAGSQPTLCVLTPYCSSIVLRLADYGDAILSALYYRIVAGGAVQLSVHEVVWTPEVSL